MAQEELNRWFELYQLNTKTGYKLDKSEIQELVRLNHLVMEATHEIHNKNMLNDLKTDEELLKDLPF